MNAVARMRLALDGLIKSGDELSGLDYRISSIEDRRGFPPTDEDYQLAAGMDPPRLPLERWPSLLYWAPRILADHAACNAAAIGALRNLPSGSLPIADPPRWKVKLAEAINALIPHMGRAGRGGFLLPNNWGELLGEIRAASDKLTAIMDAVEPSDEDAIAIGEQPLTAKPQRRREAAGITKDGLVVLNALCQFHALDEEGVAHSNHAGVRELASEINKSIQDGQTVNPGSVKRGFDKLFPPEGWKSYVAVCARGDNALTYSLRDLRGETYSRLSRDAKVEH